MLRGENDAKQSDEIQATEVRDLEFISKQLCQFFVFVFVTPVEIQGAFLY